ncbi:Flp pilus assembly protein, ATPase CpaF [Anaerolinea thermolimosa]|uniref:type II/IV secretion system ATPase subunit n=1 Tax=Anaerolinea thermolimosa TaxID=229919 RepID=UPI000783B0CA|nr:type II/IV secretion system ATPase subunit [Anaerolinea thermolimosa]GAP06157.1 Flp pilus assembly protein, ATPase CpaF [Anaerolinea thermolimosa]
MAWDFFQQTTLTTEEQEGVVQDAAEELAGGLTFRQMVDVDTLNQRAVGAVGEVLARRRLDVPRDQMLSLAEKVVGRVNGLGALLPLLRRDDLSEITITPEGRVFVLKKGAVNFAPVEDMRLEPQECGRMVEALLRPTGRGISEATPTVSAKLPRIESLPGLKGGARVHVLHPAIVPSRAGMYSVNIRLFEPAPVKPEKLVQWGVAPENVIADLLSAVSRGVRMLVIGGTASGKTTFLSAMCNAIPKDARVVKIEDPEEIWMDHPHVVTIEARKAPLGSTSVQDYTLRHGVDDAMRMSPKWLIVGEVRTGDAAAALFRAQMSDHPGLSTFHAEGPEAMVSRMALIMGVDAKIERMNAKELIAQGIEVLVQVGVPRSGDRRRLIGVWEIQPELKGGNVTFEPLYAYGEQNMKTIHRR